ncbi:hypothetical protein [Novosphingobium sp. KN65.2]|uniref:hypothetical protein n=1 Tax=Novosphingobium sp. KN65.2 TaxID=1478134 RepID=UPI0005E470A2|nr:hypothetical protein [Novosphingobium sp. KN65.2]CDO36344.1 hypothetical protein SPHV1_2310086 [Novosphingobium sp. KN65.2]
MIARVARHGLGISILAGLSLASEGCGTGSGEKPLVPPSEEATTDAEPMAIASEASVAMLEPPAAPSPVAQAGPRIPETPPVRDLAGGLSGLESKCLASVGDVTRATVISTRRIDESGPTVKIYVNVRGAQAPWLCRGNRDATIVEVMYTGSEGNL